MNRNVYKKKVDATPFLFSKVILAYLIFLAPSSFLFCQEYKEVHSIEEVAADLQNLGKDSLIIFDVDNVLITSKSAINRPVGDTIRDSICEKYFLHLSNQEKIQLQSIVWMQEKFRLTESLFPSVIQRLQEKKIPIIALTALGAGTFGVIANMAQYRIDQLRQFSIDFSLSSPPKNLVFHQMIPVNGSYPTYQDGILFTNWFQNNKGDVLIAFLKEVNWQPKKIVFFDDSEANLHAVEDRLKDLGIEFVGFHYLSESLLYDQLDIAIANKQFEYLYHYKQWVDDGDIIFFDRKKSLTHPILEVNWQK
jgi:hypothetical protein